MPWRDDADPGRADGWRQTLAPVRMERVAVVAPRARLRDALVRLAASGAVELDVVTPRAEAPAGPAAQAAQRLVAAGASGVPTLARDAPDLARLEREHAADLLAGEAQLEEVADDALVRDQVAALAGWAPAEELPGVAMRLAEVGGAVVRLPRPAGTDPPTLLHEEGRLHRSFAPLVRTYATVPYADVDPTLLAGLAYVAMFGMMFGDVGHGAFLTGAGLLLRAGRPRRLPGQLRAVWPFVVGAGLASMVFGLLYGECFGPTGLVPVVWLDPLEEPVTLLAAALGVGAVLLCGAYVVGTMNRWREGGWALALCAPSGLAGASAFLGLGLVVLGLGAGYDGVAVAGAFVAAAGLGLAFVGLLAASGGGGAGVAQAVVELFDTVVRLGTNLVSFARLAAFGLTHVALLTAVWDATTSLWDRGGAAVLAAPVVFVVGNAVAFALEALVAGVQALRLEYYELFSRVFVSEGRPFRPWLLPVVPPLPERAS
jgi:V/A-type H+-transporting ATPase subunit I